MIIKKNLKNDGWNPYLKRIPTTKKLKQDWKGFVDMENEKKEKNKTTFKIPTLQPGTTGNEILFILKDYGYYEEEKLQELIPNKKPDTIRKMVRVLEKTGYLMRKKGIDGTIILTLSRLGKDILDVEKDFVASTPQKITRMANLSVVEMMFDKSVPVGHREEVQKQTFYQSKQDIMQKYPGCEKVLSSSRMAGVYHHYDTLMVVFKLGNTMFWLDNAERQVREYLEEQIFRKKITRAIFFVENYKKEAVRFLWQDAEQTKQHIGKTLRESLELSSCYQKAFLFTTDRTGMSQLRLFRSIKYIERMFLEAVFEQDEISGVNDSIADGYINNIKCLVLFSCDIIKIKKIRRMLDTGLIDRANIICYDFQESFLRIAFAPWEDRLLYNSYYISELKNTFRLFEY